MKKWLLCGWLFLLSSYSFSEDIDLYFGGASAQTTFKPQVLIIFDNSGSMNTLEEVKSPYDPDTEYEAVGSLNALSDKFIYFTKGSGIDGSSLPAPDSPSETRRFLDDINSCATAREILAEQGFYTGYVREYTFSGNSGSWQEIPDNNGANIDVIDCQDDVIQSNPDNALFEKPNKSTVDLPDGYPANGLGSKSSPIYHASTTAESDVDWSGEVVTLYTDNYLRWAANDAIATVNLSRLAVAKDAVTQLIRSAPFAEFGLQIFNYDHPGENTRDGGRIVFGIQDMDADARDDLINIIDLEIDGETNTPLCETLYEATRYFGGKSVDFGDDDSDYSSYTGNTPPRDTSIEDSGKYVSPLTCNDEIFVILITDGQPTRDLAADTDIAALSTRDPFDVNGTDNYLAVLAEWMHNNDINDDLADVQTATLFTIGFGEDAINDAGALLREAAELGGGEYYPADDASALASALQSAIAGIGSTNSSLTSASVASNNFDRTETLNSVYYAMFLPDNGARWAGNLKKYKVEKGIQLDVNDKAAVDGSGKFVDDAQSYWSSSVDGNDVVEGGVAEMLSQKTDRVIYSNLGNNGALVDFTQENAEAATAYGSTAALATALDVPEGDIAEYISWARGIDVDDEDKDLSTTDMRKDTFGDPLHSKPLVVNYGGASESSQEVRIIIGTNAGVLHMFDDNGDTVDESWAIALKEFFPNIKTLRENFASSNKVYGVDGPIVSYIDDANGDGVIDSSTDKVWIFFGLRRGGDSYYAIDISEKDNPKLMWHIDSSSSGFGNLGQTWSTPKVGYSAINFEGDTPKPVLFFGGGYSTAKDSSSIGSADSEGVGVYMIDAESGDLLWTLSSSASSGTNTAFSGIDSIPAPIGLLDSDADGLTDRLYVGDTGGNVYRVDMPGSDINSSTTPWTAFKLAKLGGGLGNSDHSIDRRFFYEPSIVRTLITDTVKTSSKDEDGETVEVVTHHERPYDAILIGSGDRATPLAKDTDDIFFMIKDENIVTQTFSNSIVDAEEVPDTIELDDLYNFTSNPFGSYSYPLSVTEQASLEALEIAVSEKSGWYISLTESGEKGTSAAIAIAGVAYFTSYTPPPEVVYDEETCTIEINGGGYLYAVDLALGTTVYNWTDAEDGRVDDGRIKEVSEQFLGSPTLIVTPDADASADQATQGNIIVGRTVIPVGFTLSTSRNYLYIEE